MIHMDDDDNDGDDGFLPPSMNKRISMMMLILRTRRRRGYELKNANCMCEYYSPSLLNFVRGWISVLTLNGINGKLIVAVIGSLDSWTLVAGNGNDSFDKLCVKNGLMS